MHRDTPTCDHGNTPARTPKLLPHIYYLCTTTMRPPLGVNCVYTEAQSTLRRTQPGTRPTQLLQVGRGEPQSLCLHVRSARRMHSFWAGTTTAFRIAHPGGRVPSEEGPREESHVPGLGRSSVMCTGCRETQPWHVVMFPNNSKGAVLCLA